MNERNGKTTRMVVDTVVNRIVNGVYLPGQNFGTEVSLANSFRVSRTTVRRAMKYLCDIGAVEKSPGSGFAVTLAPNCLKNVVRPRLLLIRAADSPLNNEICSGIMNAPEAHYYDISIIDATGNNGNYAAILRSLPQNIGNIMLFPLDIPEVKEEIIAAVERGIKLVQLDRCLEGVAAPSVMFDNYSGACAAVRHLLVEHSLPVYFAGSSSSPESAAKRFAGWRDTMIEFGFYDYQDYVLCDEQNEFVYDLKHMQAAWERFFSANKGKVAIFSVCDHVAIQVYSMMHKFGRKIGHDTFIVGFDNLAFCEKMSPSLTSVAVNRFQLGEEAMRLLHSGITMPGWRQLMPTQLVIRQSSKNSNIVENF